jgi:hypothetical protein
MAAERRLSAELLHEHEPAAVGGAGVVAFVEGLEGEWPGAVELRELLVVTLEGFLPVGATFTRPRRMSIVSSS